MTDTLSTTILAPQGRPNWTRVHLIYFALAAFDLLAVCTGLWLAQFTATKFEQTVEGISFSEVLMDGSRDMLVSATRLMGPANEVFEDGDADGALLRLKTFSADFDVALEKLSSEIAALSEAMRDKMDERIESSGTNKFTGTVKELFGLYHKQAAEIRVLRSSMTTDSEVAIMLFRDHRLEEAGKHMSRSDDQFRQILVAISALSALADAYVDHAVEQGQASFALASTLQNVIGFAILLMVAMVCGYAHFVGKLLRGKYEELASAQAEAEIGDRMRAVNQEITALNVELAGNIKRLAEAQDEIIRRGKMAQLGQLTASVAHEIRNPLAAVRTSAYLVKRKTKDMDLGIAPQLERIENGVTRCDNIIAQLLDFARSTAAQTSEHDLDTWLEKLVEEEAEKLPAAVAIEFHPGLGGDKAYFDPARLQRAIVNLMANASEAMVGKGDDPAKFFTPVPKIQLTSQRTARGIEVVIADNGPGIAPENLAKILEPLFTTKSFGTGLGLPAVEKIMQQHGGGLDVHSEVGKGAYFTAWFPGVAALEIAA